MNDGSGYVPEIGSCESVGRHCAARRNTDSKRPPASHPTRLLEDGFNVRTIQRPLHVGRTQPLAWCRQRRSFAGESR